MRVVKYRGSSHGSNVYPFLIGADGISIFPLTSLGLDYPVSSARVSSGIEALDEMLGGEGFYRGSSILLTGTAGTGKSSCAATLVDSACQRGERCVYASFEESPDQIIRNMRSIGIDLARWAENGTLKFAAERPYRHGLERHLLRLQRLVEDFEPQVFVVDPISNLTEVGRTWQARNMLTRFIDFLKGRQVTAVFTALTPGDAALEKTEAGVSSLMDSWLLLRDVERDGERNNVLHILKSRGMEHSKQVREFQFSDDGIRLVDVYVGPEGVLTGTARYTQEMREEMESEQRRREVEADRKRLQELRELSQARIESIRAECRAEEREIEQRIRQQELEQKLDEEARKHRRQTRGGGKDND
jgi:circadian clock protein KaiC